MEETTVISLHANVGFFLPHTLGVWGYIKNQKVVILIDCDSTYNVINDSLAKKLNYFA